MSSKRKRQRRRAIAGQRVAETVATARAPVSTRKMGTAAAVKAAGPKVTSAQVVDAASPRKLVAPVNRSFALPSVAAPSVKVTTVKRKAAPSVAASLTRPRAVGKTVSAPTAPPSSKRPAAPIAVAALVPDTPKKSVDTSRTPNTCKERPKSSKSKGGGSRAFVPWCR